MGLRELMCMCEGVNMHILHRKSEHASCAPYKLTGPCRPACVPPTVDRLPLQVSYLIADSRDSIKQKLSTNYHPA